MLNNEVKTDYYASTFDISCSTFCGSLLTVGEVRTKPQISLLYLPNCGKAGESTIDNFSLSVPLICPHLRHWARIFTSLEVITCF